MDMQYCAQASFAPVFGFSHGQGTAMQFPDGQYPVQTDFHGLHYMFPYQQSRHQLMADRNALNDGKNESKPRLSKEEVEKLEKVFQENPKPSSSVKAQLADSLGLERPRINNWFQNRRAKAKQERKQEEYEARRAAERDNSEPDSPAENPSRGASEAFEDNVQRAQPSSAAFPDLDGDSKGSDEGCDDDYDDDNTEGSDALDSPYAQQSSTQDDTPDTFQSPLSIDFSPPDMSGFSHIHAKHGSSNGYTSPFGPSSLQMESLPSPDQQDAACDRSGLHHHNMMMTSFTDSPTDSFYQEGPATAVKVLESSLGETMDALANDMVNPAESAQMVSQGIPNPADSFKSPPPPANIASRRNIPRPAALQAASLNSRPYGLGPGHKAPSSPAAAMRRIASSTGNVAGRIQKPVAVPRSPMFFGRNSEALLQYHAARSPVGSASTQFTGAPPTPMTPAVVSQQSLREPTVSSTCSDDESFIVGSGFSSGIMQEMKAESNLKTPPGTPGLLTGFPGHGFTATNPFGTGLDQPLLTPFFQTEFPDLSLRNIPSYVDLSDGSLPSTPLYPNMMGSMHDQSTFGGGSGHGNTQFDWDANESVTSRSSPEQSRKHIQFTQNMTPQDYTSSLDR